MNNIEHIQPAYVFTQPNKPLLALPVEGTTSSKVIDLVKKGVNQYEHHNFDMATMYFKQALKLDALPVIANNLACIALIQNNQEKAKTYLVNAPGNTLLSYNLAIIHYQENNIPEAERLLTEITTQPLAFKAQLFLSFIQYEHKNFQKALEVLETIVPTENNPYEQEIIQYHKIAVHAALQNYAAATAVAPTSLLEENPSQEKSGAEPFFAETYNNLGCTYLDQKQYAPALKCLTHGFMINKLMGQPALNTTLAFNIGQAVYEQNKNSQKPDASDEKKYTVKTIRFNNKFLAYALPEEDGALRQLLMTSFTHIDQRNFKAVLKGMQDALDLFPDSFAVYNNYVVALYVTHALQPHLVSAQDMNKKFVAYMIKTKELAVTKQELGIMLNNLACTMPEKESAQALAMQHAAIAHDAHKEYLINLGFLAMKPLEKELQASLHHNKQEKVQEAQSA
ncbi:MAG: tetratricopeptide repeat protein [Candidatus Babeliales bacterium]